MIPSIYLHLYTQREKKAGKYPVKVRVVYLGKYHDYRTKLNLTEDEFKEASVVSPKKKFLQIRKDLDEINVRVNTIVSEIGVFTFQKFKDAYFGRLKDASDIFSFYEEYIEVLKIDGQLKTAIGYTTAMNSLKKFKSSVGFYDVDVRFLKNYHKWLLEQPISKTKTGVSETTVGIYMRKLRTIYLYAVSKGIIKMGPEYPFGKRKYIIPAGRNVKKALTITNISSIYSYESVVGSSEDKAKDFWMFSYLCNGINFKDIAMLKNSNIDGNIIRFVRAKTKRANQSDQTVISCPITEKLALIISKWRVKHDGDKAYLFDILTHGDSVEIQQKKIDQFIKTTNKYIKRISQALGITMNVTTYYSRHSAATIMKRAGVSIELISESLGHANTMTTKSYLDSFDDESKMLIAETLSNF
ncbi:MAG TPA: site-specific integrase [Mucilaginibacter sp.]|jgi:integrase|nr:site-specific integrase [Mucilaginibacter sp.]